MLFINRLKPIVAPIIYRLMGEKEPESDILQPSETEAVRPPVLLPGMLEKVTGTDEHSVLSFHLTACTETTVTHAPVYRSTYRNAFVRRSGYATWRRRERYDTDIGWSERGEAIQAFRDVRYCHSYVSWRYFGHWLTDSIPSALIDPELGELWMPPGKDWGHAKDYLAVLDIPIIKNPLVFAERLTVYQDFGQGSHKRARYDDIRDRLHSRFGGSSKFECVYLRRGNTGVPRWIANEDRLVEELVRRNWLVLDIASATVEELQRALCNARIVMSIDGSHLDHAHLSLRSGAVMLILMPHDRFSSRQLGPCRAHGVTPALFVMEGSQQEGYIVDTDDVLKTVDMAEAH